MDAAQGLIERGRAHAVAIGVPMNIAFWTEAGAWTRRVQPERAGSAGA